MYGPNQIIYDVRKKEPTREAIETRDRINTHLIWTGKAPLERRGEIFYGTKNNGREYTIKETKELIKGGIIKPKLNTDKDHCKDCLIWKTSMPRKDCRNIEHYKIIIKQYKEHEKEIKEITKARKSIEKRIAKLKKELNHK